MMTTTKMRSSRCQWLQLPSLSRLKRQKKKWRHPRISRMTPKTSMHVRWKARRRPRPQLRMMERWQTVRTLTKKKSAAHQAQGRKRDSNLALKS